MERVGGQVTCRDVLAYSSRPGQRSVDPMKGEAGGRAGKVTAPSNLIAAFSKQGEGRSGRSALLPRHPRYGEVKQNAGDWDPGQE
jgi:hypothetical protein